MNDSMSTKPELSTEDLRQLLIEYEQRRKLNPLEYFRPNGAQEERIQIDSLISIFSTGNGVGKTALGANWVGNLVFDPQNDWFKREPYLSFSRPNQGRIISTPTNIENTIIPALKDWFPPGSYKTRKGRHLYESIWKLNNGSHFNIMTYEQDVTEFEGPTLQWVWFDEPPSEELFGANVSRLRKGGYILITMTPLTGAGWVFDKLNDPWNKKKETWSITWADIEANCKEHGTRGILNHQDIERMIHEYPAEEREARISGKPLYLEGRVYPTFNPDIHILNKEQVKEFLSRPHTKYMALDPHDRKPFAMGWAAVDETDDILFYDEYPNEPFHQMKTSSLQISDYAEIIKSKENNEQVYERIIDARYGNRTNVQTGATIRDELDDHNLTFINSYTDQNASISAGHLKVREYLAYNPELPISVTNKPKLYVSESCSNIIHGFLNYTYEDFKKKEQGVKEKPKESLKDFPDVIRYLIMAEPTFLEEEEIIINQPRPERWDRFDEEQEQFDDYEYVES